MAEEALFEDDDKDEWVAAGGAKADDLPQYAPETQRHHPGGSEASAGAAAGVFTEEECKYTDLLRARLQDYARANELAAACLDTSTMWRFWLAHALVKDDEERLEAAATMFKGAYTWRQKTGLSVLMAEYCGDPLPGNQHPQPTSAAATMGWRHFYGGIVGSTKSGGPHALCVWDVPNQWHHIKVGTCRPVPVDPPVRLLPDPCTLPTE